MNKKLVLILLPVLVIGLQSMLFPQTTNTERLAVRPVSPAESQGLQFLQGKMRTTAGLPYYSVEKKTHASYSVLESIGQAMEYAALAGDKTLFDEYAGLADTYFKDPSGYYYWKINATGKKAAASSAFVDDLRLVKAYFLANERSLGDYGKQIAKTAESIFQFDIDSNGFPCGYYDGRARQKASTVPLFYLDVDTLRKLSRFDSKWLPPYQQAKTILFDMPENNHGFYPGEFKIPSRQYVWGSSVNMVENLYTALDARDAGRDTRAFAAFLKKQVASGKIYNHYYLNGKPVDDNESTAVYALAARFLALHKETEAAGFCYRRVLEFQVKDDKHGFHGGFGESDTGLVYAFDQLEALLMLRMVETENDNQ